MAFTKRQMELIDRDEKLRPVFAAVGPRLKGYRQEDAYLALLSAISAQQLSAKAADTIFGRFLNLFPDQYPHARMVLDTSEEELRSAGLSRQKLGYIRNIAAFELNRGVSRDVLNTKTDEEVIAYLTQIKGVGRWTVEMLLMFCLNRPDVFPVDDLGIQQAMTKLYRLRSGGKSLKTRMTAIAAAWQPHRSYVSRYLWRWKSITTT